MQKSLERLTFAAKKTYKNENKTKLKKKKNNNNIKNRDCKYSRERVPKSFYLFF